MVVKAGGRVRAPEMVEGVDGGERGRAGRWRWRAQCPNSGRVFLLHLTLLSPPSPGSYKPSLQLEKPRLSLYEPLYVRRYWRPELPSFSTPHQGKGGYWWSPQRYQERPALDEPLLKEKLVVGTLGEADDRLITRKEKKMGAQLSKGGVAVEGKAAADPAAAKANGQVSEAGSHMAPSAHRQHGGGEVGALRVRCDPLENGHVKTNGDVSAKPDGEVAAADGNGTAEPAKEGEASAGDAIEPAPAAEGEAAKAEGEAAKDGKKKKKFSLKNSFKFKGISLKKSKKGSEDGKEEATSPTTEDKPEENGHAAKETKEETPAAEAKEGEAAAAPADAAPEGETKAAEEAPPTEAAPTEEAAAPAEDSTPAASEGEAKAE
ncbi:hypothetical protein L3Q82_026729 [Scortum barcoo]|uniref:Uncharacterized protein n=1 Tax=Scortum barcoo TaxID=214431 RepID=A0ACB8WIX0_9TELE|nr:hypothetical protein L3Q82_026729 [Scortum barcoo]